VGWVRWGEGEGVCGLVRWGGGEGVGWGGAAWKVLAMSQSGACFCRTPVYFNST